MDGKMEISFTVSGECVAQGRPRAAVIAGHVHVYDPAKSRDYKQYVKIEAARVMQDKPLLEQPLAVALVVALPVPKSFSKKKTAMALRHELHPAKKPDIDNFFKSLDCLNGVVWRDDSQIVKLEIEKRYDEKPWIGVRAREV